MLPAIAYFILYIHLALTTYLFRGLGTISHTLFFIMQAYSCTMESLQGFLPMVSSNQVGSDSIILHMRAAYPEYL
jgi:VanZ family protein